MNGKMMTLTFFKPYAVYKENKENSFSILTYSLTCLNKDTSVWIKIMNVWMSYIVIETMVLTFLRTTCICAQSSA